MKLIILDRDGVINEDSDDYIKCASEWKPIKNSIEAIVQLKQAGWTVAVATNQSGIARGLFSETDLASIHSKMSDYLSLYETNLDYIAWCPHGPTDLCECRKPKPGLYRIIAERFNVPLRNVPIIGDSKRDLDAAVAVGALPILVKTGKGTTTYLTGNYPRNACIFPDLFLAVQHLLVNPNPSFLNE